MDVEQPSMELNALQEHSPLRKAPKGLLRWLRHQALGILALTARVGAVRGTDERGERC